MPSESDEQCLPRRALLWVVCLLSRKKPWLKVVLAGAAVAGLNNKPVIGIVLMAAGLLSVGVSELLETFPRKRMMGSIERFLNDMLASTNRAVEAARARA